MITERGSDHHAGHHGAEKQCPTRAQKNHTAVIAQKGQAFSHLTQEPLQRGFCRFEIVFQFLRSRHHAALAHCEIAKEGNDVGAHVNQQHAAQADVLVHETHDRSGNHPSALYAGEQECV